jgi:2-polyprenyl-3-methyl-5-hydroxy-6-metoxy-1,4-benzoquinol methylase
MHYRINENILIKSENAALSTRQVNKNVILKIQNLQYNVDALDYGCGKLRYTIPLSKKVKKVNAVDSKEQISRKQTINGTISTVKDYVNVLGNVFAYDLDTRDWALDKYDFILCTNVLSAIPFTDTRINVLKLIKTLLKPGGEAFLTVQYRNSYFSNYKNREKSLPFNDGWVLFRNNSTSFYGLISPEKLKEICCVAGLSIVNMKLDDGSAFFTVK